MKRQNFIRMMAKDCAEEYGAKFADFEVDAMLMTLENHGYDVNEMFGLSDGDVDSEPEYINHWNEEDYLKDCEDYQEPNNFPGKQGADVTRIVLDENDKVIATDRIPFEEVPEDIKANLPRG